MKRRILYFCNCDLGMKNGHGLMIRAHHKMLNQLYPESIITFMIPDGDLNTKYHCLPHPSRKEKLLAVLRGYTPDLSLQSVHQVLEAVESLNIDTVFIESSMFGNLIRKIKEYNSKIKVIAYFTDIEADLLEQELVQSSFKRKLVIHRLKRNEELTVMYADKTFVLNRRDENLYQKLYNKKPDAIIPIIISKQNITANTEAHKIGEELKLLFVGGDFWPNVSGIRWFVNNVLPKISVPCRLEIVGLDMEKYRTELESKSPLVRVIGTVDNISPYYEKADLFIAPIQDGGGMKVKTAEALSYGKTFLGMEESLIGYWESVPKNLKNNGIYLCTNEEDFTNSIDELYYKRFYKCRDDIKGFIESLCSYESNLQVFKQLLDFKDERKPLVNGKEK